MNPLHELGYALLLLLLGGVCGVVASLQFQRWLFRHGDRTYRDKLREGLAEFDFEDDGEIAELRKELAAAQALNDAAAQALGITAVDRTAPEGPEPGFVEPLTRPCCGDWHRARFIQTVPHDAFGVVSSCECACHKMVSFGGRVS